MEARGTAESNGADAESNGAAAESKGTAAWKPATHTRKVLQALQVYAALTTSASRGAVRDVSRIQK
jgi:dihydroxy-acid dehydratase